MHYLRLCHIQTLLVVRTLNGFQHVEITFASKTCRNDGLGCEVRIEHEWLTTAYTL
ncbi:Uncharacterised protein [Vibrio cholerae]|nr:Uncharacterised protein [Vibrio cholerae]CSH90923.1 Uncharacterised protein [Vibrio cholerae]CSI67010.1 Uncharacterised protein [Vibrio cholerae]